MQKSNPNKKFDVHAVNRNIKLLFNRSQQCSDMVLIEATVDTGFERTSLEELLHKFPEIHQRDYCLSPGRLYFTIKRDAMHKINDLRSIDHVSIVVFSDNVNFSNEKELDCKYFVSLAHNIEIAQSLETWSNYLQTDHKFTNDKSGLVNEDFKFRVTGIRSYLHSFTSMEAAAHFGGIINDRYRWKVSMTKFDLEILLYIVDNRVTVAFRLTRLSNHRRNISYFGPTTLRATVCYNMLLLAKPKFGDIILDPLCGGGSIPIECSLAFQNTFIFCGDIHEKAIERTQKNLEVLFNVGNVSHMALDATNLPFRENSIDIIVSDLPFGKRSGNCTDNRVLYKKLLEEFGRVVRAGTGRMVLLTNDRRSLLNALNKPKRHYWNKSQMLAVKLGNLKPLVACLRRNKIEYIP